MNKEQDNILGYMRENFTSEIRKSNRENFITSKRGTYFVNENEKEETSIKKNENLDFTVVLQNFLHASESQIDKAISQLEDSTNKALNETEFQMIDDNIIDRLYSILKINESHDFERKLLKIFANLTSGISIVCEKIVKKGIVDYFLNALERGFHLNDFQLLDISFWGLGNISGDNLYNRDLLFAKGVWPLLIANFSKIFDYKIEVARNGMWLFHNLLRDKLESTNYDLLQILPFLFAFCNLKYSDPYLLTDLGWTILQLGNVFVNGEKKYLFETEEIFEISRYLLSQKEMPILLPTLRFITLLCSSRIKGFTKFLGKEFLKETIHLLDYKMKIIKIEYIKMLRSMIQSESRICDILIAEESFPKKFLQVLEIEENQTKREMMKLLILYTNNLEFLDYLLQNGILDSLTNCLEKYEGEDVTIASLDWIELYLESPFRKKVKEFLVNGPILKIEKLQKRTSNEVYSKAIHILEKYFDTEEES